MPVPSQVACLLRRISCRYCGICGALGTVVGTGTTSIPKSVEGRATLRASVSCASTGQCERVDASGRTFRARPPGRLFLRDICQSFSAVRAARASTVSKPAGPGADRSPGESATHGPTRRRSAAPTPPHNLLNLRRARTFRRMNIVEPFHRAPVDVSTRSTSTSRLRREAFLPYLQGAAHSETVSWVNLL